MKSGQTAESELSGKHMLPMLTPAYPGIGGRIKDSPEDFLVEEIPAYQPEGSGEHLYIWLEKRGMGSEDAARKLGRILGVPRKAIGFAGRKDAQAITRQWFSVHLRADPDISDMEGLRILTVSRHRNKLRLGHLQGNRFHLRLRGVDLYPGWERLLAILQGDGFPNYFGSQRFGGRGDNAERGRILMLADKPSGGEGPGRSSRGRSNQDMLLLNAYQSHLFNRVLARRMTETAGLRTMLAGDLALLYRNGSVFSVSNDNLLESQQRCLAGELSPSAPLPGSKVPWTEGLPGVWEKEVLQNEGLTPEDFVLAGRRHQLPGTRRAMLEYPQNGQHMVEHISGGSTGAVSLRDEPGVPREHGGEACLALQFTLRPGTYATAFLRELCKTGANVDALTGQWDTP